MHEVRGRRDAQFSNPSLKDDCVSGTQPAIRSSSSGLKPSRIIGRYVIFDEIARGEMGSEHVGQVSLPMGLRGIVAIKRLRSSLAKDPAYTRILQEELHLASRVRHANVVRILDVLHDASELLVVMEYVHGETLKGVIRRLAHSGERIPPAIAVSLLCGVLNGLQATHEAHVDCGKPLGIIHGDVAPRNILVGCDGSARLIDFGGARAADGSQVTRASEIATRARYVVPEQILGRVPDRRSDIYGAGAVLWEALTGSRLFLARGTTETFAKILQGQVPAPSALVSSLPAALDEHVLRALSLRPDERFASAREMASALQKATDIASPREVGKWVGRVAFESLARRSECILNMQLLSLSSPVSGTRTALRWSDSRRTVYDTQAFP